MTRSTEYPNKKGRTVRLHDAQISQVSIGHGKVAAEQATFFQMTCILYAHIHIPAHVQGLAQTYLSG